MRLDAACVRAAAARSSDGVSSRRAVVLLVVMFVLAASAVVGVAALSLAGSSGEQCRAFSSRQASLDAARSGLATIVAEIESQRESMLRGGEPKLETVVDVGTLPDGSRLVYRLRSFGSVEGGRGERYVQSECAKLNVNVADAERLALLPGLSESVAAAIVEKRERGPLQSVADLVGVGGLTRTDVFGDTSGELRFGVGNTPVLADLVTVLGVDPVVQAGVRNGAGAQADERARAGVRRINVNVPWSQALSDAVASRWGAFAAGILEQVLNNEGVVLSSESVLIGELRRRRSPVESWASILDGFTTSSELVEIGRVDVLRAREEVLLAVGLSESAAAQVVELRERLDEESRLSPSWLVVSGCVTESEFEPIVDRVASRSLVWRVVIEAGIERMGDDDRLFSSGEGFAPPPVEVERPLLHGVVLEAVIDASYERARVSYLRDITHLPVSLSIAAIVRDEQADGRGGGVAIDRTLGFEDDVLDDVMADRVVWTRRTGEEMRAGDRLGSSSSGSGTVARGFSEADDGVLSGSASEGADRPRQPRVGRWIVPGRGGVDGSVR